MSASEPGSDRKGGPPPMRREEVDRFLATPRWAACCVEDDDGNLVASPVFVRAAFESFESYELVVAVPDAATAALVRDRPVPAALSADEFESYEGIVGVIVRGRLATGARTGDARFAVEHAAGFVFAGTLPRELRE